MTCDPGGYPLLVLVFAALGLVTCPVGFRLGQLHERITRSTRENG